MERETYEFDGKNDINNNEANFKCLASYPAKAKKKLVAKEDDELQESIGKRPRRQAFIAAKSRIQKSYSEKGNISPRQSIAQILAPKTLNKAKHVVVADHNKASATSATRVVLIPRKIDLRSNKEKTQIDKQIIEDSLPMEEPKEIRRPSPQLNLVRDPDVLLKKKVLKARKPIEESSASAIVASTSAASSPHASGDRFGNDAPTKQELSNEDDISEIGGRPRRKAFDVANSKIHQSVKMNNNLRRKTRRPHADQSDADNDIVSVQEPPPVQDLSKRMMGVLPEARVVLHRLTSQQLKEAGNKSKRQSVAQILARKSLEKAKHIVATRNKLLTSATVNEATESLNVHVNPNTATLMSKFRFATASGSSGSSSSPSNQYVSMTQGKPVANIVPDIGTFTFTKPVGMMPTKATGKNGLKRNELKLMRLKGKEDEAARKREKHLKAKLKEQKRKQEVRTKRALAKRGQQKLEDKGEKSADLKQKMQVGNQDKAERQTEIEKAKTGAVADAALPGPSTVNTTVPLPSSLTSNYQISPVRATKNGKLFDPDNYDIGDLLSDDSPDEWYRPKKTIPTWARSSNLIVALEQQADANIDPGQIFPKDILLKDPNLNDMFTITRERFNKRTSSADWET